MLRCLLTKDPVVVERVLCLRDLGPELRGQAEHSSLRTGKTPNARNRERTKLGPGTQARGVMAANRRLKDLALRLPAPTKQKSAKKEAGQNAPHPEQTGQDPAEPRLLTTPRIRDKQSRELEVPTLPGPCFGAAEVGPALRSPRPATPSHTARNLATTGGSPNQQSPVPTSRTRHKPFLSATKAGPASKRLMPALQRRALQIHEEAATIQIHTNPALKAKNPSSWRPTQVARNLLEQDAARMKRVRCGRDPARAERLLIALPPARARAARSARNQVQVRHCQLVGIHAKASTALHLRGLAPT